MGTLRRRAVRGLRAGDRQGVRSATLHLPAITPVIPLPLPHQHPTLSTPPALTASPPLLQGNPACTQTPETLHPLSPGRDTVSHQPLGQGHLAGPTCDALSCACAPASTAQGSHSPSRPGALLSCPPARLGTQRQAGLRNTLVPGLPRRAALPVPVVTSRCQSTGREQAATGR